ncbi:MAG: insulinase family protein, partial [Lentisphaeria bacterium]|nr:insulinase family protein [Lentisphaeria bacterium]
MKKNLIPSLEEITHCVRLENGLEAYILPLRSAPVVSVQAYVRTGSIHEEEFLGCGLSHFLEHMLFMGSSRYPGNAASDKVSSLGGYFNACTGRDYTSYIVFLPSRHFGEALDILDDMLRNPLFPEEKFQSEKNVILR